MGKYDRIDTMCPVAKEVDMKELFESIDAAVTAIGGDDTGLIHDVAAIETVVGDETAGLVHDVAGLRTDVNIVVAAPAAEMAELDATKKIITIPMNCVVFNGVGLLPIDVKPQFSICTDGETYGALGETDTITFGGRFIQITLAVELTTATNTIKIASGAIISAHNISNEEIITNNLDATA